MATPLLRTVCLPTNIFKFHTVIRRISGNAVLRSSQPSSEDLETHTGQKWEADDYRLARFTYTPKQISEKRAIDLIAEVAPMASEERVVSCDGGGGPLGHPKVYINLDQPGSHTCGYCGLRFYKEDHHH